MTRLEFFRHAFALMPGADDRFPAIAVMAPARKGLAGYRACSCAVARQKRCVHLKALERIRRAFVDRFEQGDPAEAFRQSVWYRLAAILAERRGGAPDSVGGVIGDRERDDGDLCLVDRSGDLLLVYQSAGSDRERLVDRLRTRADESVVPSRGDVLRDLTRLTMTDDERLLCERGMRTVRQALEESFWHRFAYHCFMEYHGRHTLLQPSIDTPSGDFFLTARFDEDTPLFYVSVPRKKVRTVLTDLADALANQHGLRIAPLSLDAVFDVSLNEGLGLEIRPLLRLIQQNGERRFFKREDLTRYQYGDLYYIKELGMLVEDRYPASPPDFTEPLPTVVRKSQVPLFLARHGADLQGETFRLDEKVRRLQIMDRFDQVEIGPEVIERDWLWLSVSYGDGSQSVSLRDLLAAKKADQRFVATDRGWVDCQAPAFDFLDGVAERASAAAQGASGDLVGLSRIDVLRLFAGRDGTIQPAGEAEAAAALHNLLSLQPTVPMPALEGLRSRLRGYQQRGVDWLRFLYENRLGGLLCDDMGLGKTHQVMALLVALREAGGVPAPFLVVCPTSVLGHWEQKLACYAPGLAVVVHHGGGRDPGAMAAADVIVTSYGILWRDIEALGAIAFAVAVFDEMQQIKNAETRAYQAARDIVADIKLGVSGTPLENRLSDLKALMDIVLPGYLGSDEDFRARYQVPIEQEHASRRQEALRRLIHPFTLRRLKKSVLHELPEKIEDLRTCRLSEQQVKLYRDAVEQRGRDLLGALHDAQAVVPYMHIFALLHLLKQICDHPALVENAPDQYADHASGKWDLFTELLAEALDSGQKVVVYSQYLAMVEIIARHLTTLQVDHVALTGRTRNRGERIRRFNADPDCRVFVGSLKAGGVGIDLVAASVVIHYDRWWNAAREDQATDRVHRIGQTRGVQVFKLITEGTLEEKIAAIIQRKRNLLDTIVQEDDPNLVKTFDRRELIEMLALPAYPSSDGF
ncbi:DEAD/DEAH box helicase [Desulfatitalea alkaliphila]|uniref:DEAD/DEAH box helicase n=1 Tax=Desulfatitalea alkaliphila TaxID=2929485 RepID=A0AA41UHS7_9BACT|nr:DEAD/DEAH box helicase [Desulfatitalea alkaliphila]MCJ8499950.1 DEAD/DEAH box helicase [Desulfatitalea alkaliphila]